MKKLLFIPVFHLLCYISIAQDKVGAEKLVDEGVAYHDKGDYKSAISKYDKALELDKDNLVALTEKALSLFSLKKYDESITTCQKAIAAHPDHKGLRTVYVTYGTVLDGQKKTDNAIEIYDQGIKQFPDYYLLHFNKGVTLSGIGKFDDALLCFQKAVTFNPNHASSHNGIARISHFTNNRIPALLAYARYLTLDPQSSRAKENYLNMQKIMNGNVEKTGSNSITINLNSNSFGDTTTDGKPKENNFRTTDLMLSLSAALDHDKKNKKKTDVENFIRKFENVCASLEGSKEGSSGFFWTYYAPYFIEMKDKNLVETFSHIAFTPSDDSDVVKWIGKHKSEIEKFREWSDRFVWGRY